MTRASIVSTRLELSSNVGFAERLTTHSIPATEPSSDGSGTPT